MKKRSIAVLLFLAMCVCLFAGCGETAGTPQSNINNNSSNSNGTGNNSGSGSNDGYTGERAVTIGAASDIESFNPYANLYSERYSILSLVYQPLVLNVDNVFYNVLISGYDQTDDFTFVLHLRDNITDSAGNPFKASDVVYSFKLANESGFFSKTDDIKRIEATDELTVEIEFVNTMLYGEIDMITTQIFMVTEAAYSTAANGMASDPIGTGPCVVDDYMEGSYVVYKINPNYWNTAGEGEDGFVPFYDVSKLDSIRYDFITEASSRAIALESGSIDVANMLDYVDYSMYKNDSKYSTYWRVGEVYDATYNCDENRPLNNLNLRYAISHCIDIENLIIGAFDGQAEANKGMNNTYHLDCPDFIVSDSYEYYTYDLDVAKDYLQKYFDETGKTAADTNITILVVNSQELERVAEICQTFIRALGIGCDVQSYDSVTRKTIRNSRDGWDIAIAKDTATDLYNCDKLNMQWNRTTGKSMAGGWVDDETLDNLMKAAVAPATHSKETMGAFEEYFYENAFGRSLIIDRLYSASASWVDKVDGSYGYTSPLASVYNWSAK